MLLEGWSRSFAPDSRWVAYGAIIRAGERQAPAPGGRGDRGEPATGTYQDPARSSSRRSAILLMFMSSILR